MSIATRASPIQPEPGLHGQTLVVIGGSSGIGLETARRARAEGANLILVSRNQEPLVHLMTSSSLTGATYAVDGGQQLID